MGIDVLRVIDTGLDPVTAEREQWDDGNNTLAIAPTARGRLRAQRQDQRPARGRRDRGGPDRRQRAGQRPRRPALHVLPDPPRPALIQPVISKLSASSQDSPSDGGPRHDTSHSTEADVDTAGGTPTGQESLTTMAPGWSSAEIDRDLCVRALLAWRGRPTERCRRRPRRALGCYLGKSGGWCIGESLQPTETFTVCDLFGDASADQANSQGEPRRRYAPLGREQFEDELPQDPLEPSGRPADADAREVLQHIEPDCDAVRRTSTRRTSMSTSFDDVGIAPIACSVRTASWSSTTTGPTHAPGVAAAVWIAMANDGLKPSR